MPVLEDTLSSVRNLPIPSQVAVRLLELLNSPHTSINDINAVMSKDPSLAATVLKVVNSSYYGIRHRVSSLSHALSLLGYRVTKNIVLTAAASGLFRIRSCTPCFNLPTFALHSVASAAVCRYLCNYSGIGDPEQAYSLGLLHDIGKLAMDQCFPKEYLAAVTLAHRSHQPLHIAEKGVWGHDHAEVGEALVRIWKLPQELSQAIGLHHDPQAYLYDDLLATLHISSYACSVKGFNCHDVFVAAELNEAAWRRLHLDAKVMSHLFSTLDKEIDSARQMFVAANA